MASKNGLPAIGGFRCPHRDLREGDVIECSATLESGQAVTFVITVRLDHGRPRFTVDCPKCAEVVQDLTPTPGVQPSAASPSTNTGPSPSASPSVNSVDEAMRLVTSMGFGTYDEQVTWGPSRGLHVLTGICIGSADGKCANAFFFADGTFVGRDAPDPETDVAVDAAFADTVVLRYGASYQGLCCPTRFRYVTFRWDGMRLSHSAAVTRPPIGFGATTPEEAVQGLFDGARTGDRPAAFHVAAPSEVIWIFQWYEATHAPVPFLGCRPLGAQFQCGVDGLDVLVERTRGGRYFVSDAFFGE